MSSTHFSSLISKRLHIDVLLLESTHEIESILINSTDLVLVIDFLRRDPDAYMDLLLDIFCVDHKIFYHLRSSKLGYRLHLSIESDILHVPSLRQLYPGALWLEHEIQEQYGVEICT